MLVFGRSCCFRAKVVVFGQSGCILTKVSFFGQGGCSRAIVVVFVKKWLYSRKNSAIGGKRLYLGEMVVFW